MENREASGYVEKSVNLDTNNPAAASNSSRNSQGRGVFLKTNQVVLGVDVRNIDDDLVRQKGLGSGYGIYVEGVFAGSLAESNGIRVGDIITRVGESEVNSRTELIMAMEGYEKGDELNLTFERPGVKRDIARAEPHYPDVEGLPYFLAEHEFVKMLIDSFTKASQFAVLNNTAKNVSYVATFQNRIENNIHYPERFYGNETRSELAKTIFTLDSTGGTTTEIR